ncbi:Zinc finger, MYND-type [Phaffia rhodozyma]|uniref:Zinc finger, MYND-type n=1 Tax=Phaffia rhodozyma TaxID=264483 RepID=A0A0F7ST45_PHARH|nr:Zinc finger, MYND-type [Phaffia rhodozyma]
MASTSAIQNTYCRYCGKGSREEGRNFQKCGVCYVPVYCGKKCQVDHWKNGHKAECEKAKKMRESESLGSNQASDEVPLEGLHDWEDENSNKLWIAGLHALGLYDKSNWSRMDNEAILVSVSYDASRPKKFQYESLITVAPDKMQALMPVEADLDFYKQRDDAKKQLAKTQGAGDGAAIMVVVCGSHALIAARIYSQDVINSKKDPNWERNLKRLFDRD